MTREEFYIRFELIKIKAFQIVFANAPVRTGNLASSVKFQETPYGFKIIVDTSKAPYMKYTEEPWTYNSRWGKTLPNPREGWFKKSIDLVVQIIINEFGGELINGTS